MAEKVILYQELEAEARRSVDEHAAACAECARDLEILKGVVAQLTQVGEKKRAALTHPSEEALIQFAVEPRLLADAEQRTVRDHLEVDRCFACKKIYRSVQALEKEAEKEAAAQAGRRPEARAAVPFWEKYRLALRVATVAAALLLALGLPLGVYKIVTLQDEVARVKEAHGRDLLQMKKTDQALKQKEAEVRELGRQVAALAEGSQKQAQMMAQLRQPSASEVGLGAFGHVRLSTSRAEKTELIDLPKNKRFIHFYLPLSGEEKYESTRWLLKDRQGNVLWQSQARVEGETLDRFVEAGLFRAGERYTLEIYGREAGQTTLLAKKEMRLGAGR